MKIRSHLRSYRFISLVLTLALAPAVAGQERARITRAADLPALAYAVPPSAADIVSKTDAFVPFATRVRADIEKLLRDYDIADMPTLSRLQTALIDLDLLDGRFAAALSGIASLRAVDERARVYDQSLLFTEALAMAGPTAGASPEAYRAALVAAARTLLDRHDWTLDGAGIAKDMGFFKFMTEAQALALAERFLSVEAQANSGSIRLTAATIAVAQRSLYTLIVPNSTAFKEAYEAAIAAHRPADGAPAAPVRGIWDERSVALDASSGLTPVVVAVWDTGVDIGVFKSQLWQNPREQANGLDNDGNGYVGDVHGIGFKNDAECASDLLPRLSEDGRRAVADQLEALMGSADARAGRDTPAATAFQKRQEEQASWTPQQLAAQGQAMQFLSIYAHGTHVAGIALDGNPAARLMTLARLFDLEGRRVPATVAWSRQVAERFKELSGHLATHNVRVVNMSFGDDVAFFEHTLREGGVGATDALRHQEAEESFGLYREALMALIKGRPEVLFVCSAGNMGDDATFTGRVPQSFDLANLLCVGAANEHGRALGNSSVGERVSLHANGSNVESYAPGGGRLAISGTSQAAPQVTNLAAKILAVNPSLSVSQLVALVRDGATPSPDGRMKLIHPRRTVELARPPPDVGK